MDAIAMAAACGRSRPITLPGPQGRKSKTGAPAWRGDGRSARPPGRLVQRRAGRQSCCYAAQSGDVLPQAVRQNLPARAAISVRPIRIRSGLVRLRRATHQGWLLGAGEQCTAVAACSKLAVAHWVLHGPRRPARTCCFRLVKAARKQRLHPRLLRGRYRVPEQRFPRRIASGAPA